MLFITLIRFYARKAQIPLRRLSPKLRRGENRGHKR